MIRVGMTVTGHCLTAWTNQPGPLLRIRSEYRGGSLGRRPRLSDQRTIVAWRGWGRRIRLTMPLQIYAVPGRGLGLMGTLATSDVERLVQAIRGGDRAIALDFRSGVMSVRADAATALFQRLNELWGSGEMRRPLTLHAVPGAVADAPQAAGFEPEGGEPAGHFVLLID